LADARIQIAIVERVGDLIGVSGAVEIGLDFHVDDEDLSRRLLFRAKSMVGVERHLVKQDAVAHGDGPPACRPGTGGPRGIASVMRATRTIAFTSWARTTSTPFMIATATVAAVPSSRSCTGRFKTLPMLPFLDVPMRSGRPSTVNSRRRRRISRFSSTARPKPY